MKCKLTWLRNIFFHRQRNSTSTIRNLEIKRNKKQNKTNKTEHHNADTSQSVILGNFVQYEITTNHVMQRFQHLICPRRFMQYLNIYEN